MRRAIPLPKTLTITVDPPLVALSVTTASLPGAGLGVAYSKRYRPPVVSHPTMEPYGGKFARRLDFEQCGRDLRHSHGGTGTSHFTVTVTDSQTPTPKTSSAALSITVALAPLSVATTSLVDGVKGNAYSQTLQASGGTPPIPTGPSPLAPAGQLDFERRHRRHHRHSTATGTSNFTVKVTDSAADTATANLSITVNGALAITNDVAAGRECRRGLQRHRRRHRRTDTLHLEPQRQSVLALH